MIRSAVVTAAVGEGLGAKRSEQGMRKRFTRTLLAFLAGALAWLVDADGRSTAMENLRVVGHVLRVGTVELYDLGSDPGEKQNLYEEGSALGRPSCAAGGCPFPFSS